MMNSFEIRFASVSDASAIAKLIYSTSMACCFTPEQPCPEWFKVSVSPTQITSHLKSRNMVWAVAEEGQSLVGVLAISDSSNVKYFFVHPSHQKVGIGMRLWLFVSNNGLLGSSVTVRSSLFAVLVYERLGFKVTEPPKEFNGLHYQTMCATYG
jgi:GNAT superfamily N-acetyltransferase